MALYNPFKKSKPFLTTVYSNIKGALRADLLYTQLIHQNILHKGVTTIVDIGCGSAPVSSRLLSHFLNEGHGVCGIFTDDSKEMVEKAEQKVAQAVGVEHKQYVREKMLFEKIDHKKTIDALLKNSWGFDMQKPSLIMSHAVLNWLENPYGALDDLITLAHEGAGVISLVVGSRTGYILELSTQGNFDAIQSVLETGYVQSESYKKAKLYLFEPHELLSYIERAGMEIVGKYAVRSMTDLIQSSIVEKGVDKKQLFELEQSVSETEDFWATGDLVHIIFRKPELKTDKMNNVYAGEHSLHDYLSPEDMVPTPLVELPKELNPFHADGIRVFAKMMNALPLANVKSLPAFSMLDEQNKKGLLKKVQGIIENSSGNTVYSLAVIARLFGIHKTKAIVSHEVRRGKLDLLRFFGVDITVNKEAICPDPEDPTSGIYLAKEQAKSGEWCNPGQYDNQANPDIHYRITGPQIWKQTQGRINTVSVGLGTTGSVVGISKYLKEKKTDVRIVGVTRAPNNPVPGVRTVQLLKQIAFDWKGAVDAYEEIGTRQSYDISLQLCRAGILVGPSSGFAYAGLLAYLKQQKEKNLLQPGHVAIFICPDSPFPYMDEYFEYLDSAHFPKIQNADLLITPVSDHSVLSGNNTHDVHVVSPQEVFDLYYVDKPNTHTYYAIDAVAKDVLLVDVRKKQDYEDFHAPWALSVPFADLDKYVEKNIDTLKQYQKIIFVCKLGNTSVEAAIKAQKIGLPAYSMSGGMIEWSMHNLPRVKAQTCAL